MITYTYIVRCPECEDEFFDFFDEAKDFAMGCLTKKPIITQTEVNRNDFGECTDHCDLGTIWSWEDVMGEGGYTEAEPTKSIFTKDDLKLMADGQDPEFDAIDNSVDFEPEISEVSPIERKPIPEGMTIEQLVEEMEENEDTVECTWCEELFDKSECRKEVDLGWLCGRCEAAIKSRGETLTFRENNYWDFLDEDADKLTETSLTDIMTDVNREHGTNYTERDILDAEGIDDGEFFNDLETQNEITAEAQRRRRQRQIYAINKAKAEREARQQQPKLEDLDPEELHDLGNEYDGGYPAEKPELSEIDEVSDSHLKLCPECGEETFDHGTGICLTCGFN